MKGNTNIIVNYAYEKIQYLKEALKTGNLRSTIKSILIFFLILWLSALIHQIGHLCGDLGNGQVEFLYFIPYDYHISHMELNLSGLLAIIFLTPLYIYYLKKKSLIGSGIAFLISYNAVRWLGEYFFHSSSIHVMEIFNFNEDAFINITLWILVWIGILILTKLLQIKKSKINS